MQGILGEIRMYAGSSAPSGWHFCDGASLSIASYSNLYAVLGTNFGGSGGNFNLPNFEGRTSVGVGAGIAIGETGGAKDVTLDIANLPAHNHAVTGTVTIQASSDGLTEADPSGRYLGLTSIYSPGIDLVNMAPPLVNLSTATVGNGDSFGLMQPYLGVHYIISQLSYLNGK